MKTGNENCPGAFQIREEECSVEAVTKRHRYCKGTIPPSVPQGYSS